MPKSIARTDVRLPPNGRFDDQPASASGHIFQPGDRQVMAGFCRMVLPVSVVRQIIGKSIETVRRTIKTELPDMTGRFQATNCETNWSCASAVGVCSYANK